MSLKIIKAGLLDTIQDLGRYGFQHQGINPGGVMDRFSAALVNALLGKALPAPVIEMHFPAPQLLFQKKTVFCLAGANFTPLLNDAEVPIHQPIAVNDGAILSFGRRQKGARCYMSVLIEWDLEPWLKSYSTNLKAAVGGYKGLQLKKGDDIAFSEVNFTSKKNVTLLPWQYHADGETTNEILFIPGPEWNWLSTKAQTFFLNNNFSLTSLSDRMGYRLQGEGMEQANKEQLLSSAVNFGTVQLLPNGQLIVLMADHQTTGGYPRVANVITAHLPKLAQCNAGDNIRFVMTNVDVAEDKWLQQQHLLQQLQNTCNLKIENWLNAHRY